jgi:hypothetical protein
VAAPVVTMTAQTNDAAPSSSPFKVSHVDTKDEVVASASIVPNGVVSYRQFRLDGNRKTGTRLLSLGAVCGITYCGAPGAMPLADSDDPRVYVYNDADFDDLLTSGEGDYTLAADALNADGWSV